MTVERMVDWMDTKLDQKMAEMSVEMLGPSSEILWGE